MSDPGDRLVEFDRLNVVGKAVYLSGQAARVAGGLIDAVVDQAASIYVQAERAFRDGLDPEIEDARILEETDDRKPR